MEGDDLKLHTQTFDYRITDIAFQPLHSKPTTEALAGKPPQRILATASDTGQVYLWNVLNGITCLQKLEMGFDAVAQCLAFSPDGFLLAAAGYDTLNVWKTLEGTQPKCVWRIPHGTNERWKSEEGEQDEEDKFVHKLGWDADGKRIAFGMNGQVAVIRL
jgi:WD40 repeat protein